MPFFQFEYVTNELFSFTSWASFFLKHLLSYFFRNSFLVGRMKLKTFPIKKQNDNFWKNKFSGKDSLAWHKFGRRNYSIDGCHGPEKGHSKVYLVPFGHVDVARIVLVVDPAAVAGIGLVVDDGVEVRLRVGEATSVRGRRWRAGLSGAIGKAHFLVLGCLSK